MDPSRTGSHPALTRSHQMLRRSMRKISEQAYREAFVLTSKMKCVGEKLKKEAEERKKGTESTDRRDDIDDGSVKWTESGMDDYRPGSSAYDRRHKRADSP
ncbi:unnamed protein product, partial [Ectocarpus sp. 12 AP-2014]